jgi:hypothetical protein
MNYNKILKLASYFRNKNDKVYFDILKLAWDNKFLSLVLGSYPSRGDSENESKTRRLNVVRLINDPSKTDYTISEMANIINDERHDDIKRQDQSEIWKDYLSPSQLSELIKLVPVSSPAEPQRSPVSNGGLAKNPALESLFSKLNALKRHHDLVRLVISEFWKEGWSVPRSYGRSTKSWIEKYNHATKQARFTVGHDERGNRFTKDVFIEDILSENKDKENKSLEWLVNTDILPISVPKTGGGVYNGCLLKDLKFQGNYIICNFEFFIGEFEHASKEIWIDPEYAPIFYKMNRDTLDSV